MNFEELYQEYQTLDKDLKDKLKLMQKLQKAIDKEMSEGDLKSVDRDIIALKDAVMTGGDILDSIKTGVDRFERKQYFEEGEFAEQLLSACEENGVDVKGDYPIFEMFPYKVRIDADNQDLYLDRKKVQCMRPQHFIKTVKAGQDKLMKASFNALAFANELSDAYDLALLKKKKAPDADVYLLELYKILAPMGRFRRDYDQQSYAFDLARLYAAGIDEIRDGRKIQFGPSRIESKAIRILDGNGKEQYLATIRFYT